MGRERLIPPFSHLEWVRDPATGTWAFESIRSSFNCPNPPELFDFVNCNSDRETSLHGRVPGQNDTLHLLYGNSPEVLISHFGRPWETNTFSWKRLHILSHDPYHAHAKIRA